MKVAKSFPVKALWLCSAVFLTLAWLTSCKKDSGGMQPVTTPIAKTTAAPTIVAISPNSGPFSTLVHITGTGFSTTLANNTVQFNGVTAVVDSATATALVVKVPLGAGVGAVTVSVGSQLATGPVFNYVYTTTVSTVAGSLTGGVSLAGYKDGPDSLAQFNDPTGLVLDGSGNIYVADAGNSCIRKISTNRMVSTLQVTGLPTYGQIGFSVSAPGNFPSAIYLDAAGSFYLTEQSAHRVDKISPAGTGSTITGNGHPGHFDGPRDSSELFRPSAITFDNQGNIIIADAADNCLRALNGSGYLYTLTATANYPSFPYGTPATGMSGYLDGPEKNALFNDPNGLAADAAGNLYVADALNNVIRKISTSGAVSTFAGNGTAGYADGAAQNAQFYIPAGLAFDAKGNLYVAEQGNNCIRMITPAGVVSTFAGVQYVPRGGGAFADGPANKAYFAQPYGLAVDAQGNVYVADFGNNLIRKIAVQ